MRLHKSLHCGIDPLQSTGQHKVWLEVSKRLQCAETVVHRSAALGVNTHEGYVSQTEDEAAT